MRSLTFHTTSGIYKRFWKWVVSNYGSSTEATHGCGRMSHVFFSGLIGHMCLCSFADSCWVLPGLWWLHCIHLHHPDYRPASPSSETQFSFCLYMKQLLLSISSSVNFSQQTFILFILCIVNWITNSVYCIINLLLQASAQSQSSESLYRYSLKRCLLFVFLALQPTVVVFSQSGSGLSPPRFRGFLITHNDEPQSEGLLWTSDQPVAETCTWQHTTLTTDKHPCPRWDSNPRSQQASGRRPTP